MIKEEDFSSYYAKVKSITRYIEVFSNITDELLFRIKVSTDVNELRNIIDFDDDDPLVYGLYRLTNANLEMLGIENHSDDISFLIGSEAEY